MHPLLSRRRPLHRAVCLLLCVAFLPGNASWAAAQEAAAPAPGRQPEGPALLPTACVVLLVRPKQLAEAPALQSLPLEVVRAAALKELGLDPVDAEQIAFSIEPPLVGPPSYILHAQFAGASRLPQGRASAHAEAGQLGGKPYLQSRDPAAPSFYLPNERTLWAMPDGLLRRMAVGDSPSSRGRLAELVGQQWRQDDAFALIDLELLRPLVNVALTQVELPPERARWREVPNLLRMVRLRVNLSQPGPTELVVGASSEQAAERLAALFEEAKAEAAANIATEAARLSRDPDPVQQALGRYQQRMAERWRDEWQLRREGSEIVLVRADLSGEGTSSLWAAGTIGVLGALLLPAVQAAREAARRTTSQNNLRQLTLALHSYAAVEGSFPPHATYDDQGRPLLSWRVHMLPYMGQTEIYEQFRLDEPWDSPHNQALIPQMPEVFLDASSTLTVAEGRTHYLGVVGARQAFSGDRRGRAFAEFTDGTSNTLLAVQAGDDKATIWTKPDDWAPGDAPQAAHLGKSLHPGGFLAAFADGSVQFLLAEIDGESLRGLTTIDGGEATPR